MKYRMRKSVNRLVGMGVLGLMVLAPSYSYADQACNPGNGAGLIFSIDEPLIQESTVVADVLNTYDFESVPNSNLVFRDNQPNYTTAVWDGVGTYEGTGSQIDMPNKYGAAYGVGKYLFIRSTIHSIEANPGVTLTFDEPVAYFGFWWSAGDYANKLQVTLSGGTVYDVETELVWESEGFIEQNASQGGHMGSPATAYLDQNSGEPYAYLNLTSKDECSKIASIRFHGRNFETDNHTVTTELIDPPGIEIPLPPVAPVFGQSGRFNIQEVNEFKTTAQAEGGGAVN